MIVGIGTDILRRSRIEMMINDMEDPFFKRIFTESEKKEGMDQSDRLTYFAGRFAAKEAIFKTFKVHGDLIHLRDIEILKSEIGYPVVQLYGTARAQAMQKKISTIELSLSNDSDYVIAYAIAVSESLELEKEHI